MPRRAILAIVFCALVAILAAHRAHQADTGFMASGLGECRASGGAGTDSGGHWRAPGTNASITESLWRSTLVHADLAGVQQPGMVAAIGSAHRPAHRLLHAPGLPLRIPLLI